MRRGTRFGFHPEPGARHKCSLYGLTWRSIDACGGKHGVGATRVASNLWSEHAVDGLRASCRSIGGANMRRRTQYRFRPEPEENPASGAERTQMNLMVNLLRRKRDGSEPPELDTAPKGLN